MIIAILLFMLLFAFLVLFVMFSSIVGFLLTRVPFVTTSQGDIELIVKNLPITSKDYFYDLGSGDGKVTFLVERLSGAKIKGFELTWWTHLLAKIKKTLLKSQGQFVNKNFFKEDWAEATIIYGYLFPPLMRRVEEKFVSECKKGTIAVIRDFPLPTLKPIQTIPTPHKHIIYIYRLT